MQLRIQTSDLSNLIPIQNFKALYELAKCSKCQMFILKDGVLYGASDDCAVIHEIQVPFPTNTDLIFRVDMFPKEFVDMNIELFIPREFPWVFMDVSHYNDYIGGNFYAEYVREINQYVLYDKRTGLNPTFFFSTKIRPIDDVVSQTMVNQLEGLLIRQSTLLPPIIFTGLENNETVRYVFDSKSITGESLINLVDSTGRRIVFYISKGLFSLGKSDLLNINIRFDAFDSSLFMATFMPTKKKPIKVMGTPFSERIHCMYTNLA